MQLISEKYSSLDQYKQNLRSEKCETISQLCHTPRNDQIRLLQMYAYYCPRKYRRSRIDQHSMLPAERKLLPSYIVDALPDAWDKAKEIRKQVTEPAVPEQAKPPLGAARKVDTFASPKPANKISLLKSLTCP